MKKTIALVLLLIAMPALAHPGHDGSPLQDGLLHPLTGLDHLLMLIGTGMLAALSRRNLVLPAFTLTLMFCGALMGHFLGDLIGVQSMIFGSLLVISAALLMPQRQSLPAMTMPLFALFHGWAHGAEASPDAFWSFSLGFMLVSGVLLLAGFVAGELLAQHPRLQKAVGGGVLTSSAMLILG
ncbi:HupE/UreJ family protein [Pseudomonas moorei]|uniref:HupE/UreJ family protein n=1 Tax=Pseudomonas moorei TaxID=395599 RepID=UPI001FF17496|nr:HupE/UreJ family protein [Pseudomonas moorei]